MRHSMRQRVACAIGAVVALPIAFCVWLGLLLYEWGRE